MVAILTLLAPFLTGGGAPSVSAPAVQPPKPAYQAVMMRAAPGHLLDLIEALKGRMIVYGYAGEARPILLRHSQGDQWDLLLLVPIGSMAEYFGNDRSRRWRDAVRRIGYDDEAFTKQSDQWVSWREELYVEGPPVAELQAAAAASGYFHLEIFQALAGKRDSLLQERAMENDFLGRIGRPVNFVFTRITGPAWDAFTLGFYRDLQHYAEPARVSGDEEDRSARAAGFASRNHIGAYLRQFLQGHHDTLGSIVR